MTNERMNLEYRISDALLAELAANVRVPAVARWCSMIGNIVALGAFLIIAIQGSIFALVLLLVWVAMCLTNMPIVLTTSLVRRCATGETRVVLTVTLNELVARFERAGVSKATKIITLPYQRVSKVTCGEAGVMIEGKGERRLFVPYDAFRDREQLDHFVQHVQLRAHCIEADGGLNRVTVRHGHAE